MTETVQELDLSFEELEVLVGPDCAGVDQKTCDLALGGGVTLSLTGAAITIAIT